MTTSTAQLDLFEENDEATLLRAEMEALKKQMEKMRSLILKRHNQLAKLCVQLEEENQLLKRRLDALERASRKGEGSSDSDLIERLFSEAYFFSYNLTI
jgi:hypothetical protein